MTIQSLKTVIRCRDLARSRELYVDLLGLELVEEWDQPDDRGCILSFGGNGGFLELLEVATGHASHEQTSADAGGAGSFELQMRVDEVDMWIGRLEGRVSAEGPVTRPWGNRYLWFRDPDGVRIALFQAPQP